MPGFPIGHPVEKRRNEMECDATVVKRSHGRAVDEMRPIRIVRRFTRAVPGSVLIEAGFDDGSPRTVVLCTASVEESVPMWRKGQGAGWVTAEYAMLPGSTTPRKSRERSRTDSRSSEIQRLIGRSLRMAVDLKRLGERTITIDCDVLEGYGGTRTLAITGGMIALTDAVGSLCVQENAVSGVAPLAESPMVERIAAVSVGLVGGAAMLDLDYPEDSTAEADCNVVMTASGKFVEVQATGERAAIAPERLAELLTLAQKGIFHVFEAIDRAVG